jgi:hypothetical protein
MVQTSKYNFPLSGTFLFTALHAFGIDDKDIPSVFIVVVMQEHNTKFLETLFRRKLATEISKYQNQQLKICFILLLMFYYSGYIGMKAYNRAELFLNLQEARI